MLWVIYFRTGVLLEFIEYSYCDPGFPEIVDLGWVDVRVCDGVHLSELLLLLVLHLSFWNIL